MKKSALIPTVIIGIAVILGIMVISVGNGLNRSEQNVEEKWSQVENVMQRRADLIPNLVNAVKGSMNQEKEVFSNIAEARKTFNNASGTKEKMEASTELNNQVGTLINVINENYPTLSSNENVKTLMTQLEGSENRISVERKRYNEAVTEYNNKIVSFPSSFVASMKGKEKKEFFKGDENSKKVPEVNLD